ncbi:hypothetical protein HOF78_03150 [Candidatus Woesearchaeota archaeon]|jgi:hypothetical protein|nr:hypothetical protein [Candidatus Woesearchaeota archaeon]MBT6044633.1 hypothetical protein [Candidatus Woesearchaeota archaeon]
MAMSRRRDKILAAAHHFGSANAISPVIKLLDRSEHHEVLPFGLRPATIAFEENGFRFGQWNDFQPLKDSTSLEDVTIELAGKVLDAERPDLIFVGSSTEKEYNGPEKSLVIAGTRRGIPSVGVLDFWGDYALRVDDLERTIQDGAMPNILCVPDEFAKREFLEKVKLKDESRLVVTGNPYHDTVLRRAEAITDSERLTTRAKMGLPTDRILFYIANAFKEDEDRHKYWDLDNIRTLGDVVLDRVPEFSVGISLHGRMPDSEKQEIADYVGDNPKMWLVDPSEVKPLEGALVADVVATPFSTCGIEAAIAGNLVISMQSRYSEDRLPTNQMGVTYRADDVCVVSPLLIGLLNDSNFKYEVCPNLAGFRPDGKSAERIVEEIDATLGMY